MTPSTPSDVQAAIDVAVAGVEPKRLVVDQPFFSVVAPAGATHHLIEVDEYKHAPNPERAKGTYRPATVDAFVAVVERLQSEQTTTLWVHPTEGKVVAIFNDTNGVNDLPGWRDHRAELQLQHTKEWKHWSSQDGSLLAQATFAEHIEDGLPELVAPPAADMLELAQTMQATIGAEFRSAVRLDNGEVQTRYDEKVDAAAGRSGQMTIPQQFELAVAPFLGEDPYKITARLRYRLNGGKLTIGYRLERPENVVRDCLAQIAEKLADTFPAVFEGAPA